MSTTTSTAPPKRGEIWRVDFDPTRGAEMRKVRPAVIISTDHVGKLPLRIVVPITDWNERFDLYPLANGTSVQDWDRSRQNTGLHIIKTHQDVNRFKESLSVLDLSQSEETTSALEYCVAELGRNVVQHAFSPSGGVAIAQVFPDRAAVQISICDSGQGILSALSPSHPELLNHLEGLKAAVLPHVSGAFKRGYYSASENAGLGLFFTKEIAWRAGGSFFLTSGDHILSEHHSTTAKGTRTYRKTKGRTGTSVTVDMPVDSLGDFANLLQLCRELAASARQAPGKAGLDFLSEVPILDGLLVVTVDDFAEDVEQASHIRDTVLLPKLAEGGMIVLDFARVRFATQSFVHALLHDAFRVKGSLVRLSFANCTRSTEEAIRAVAAYAASYKLCV